MGRTLYWKQFFVLRIIYHFNITDDMTDCAQNFNSLSHFWYIHLPSLFSFFVIQGSWSYNVQRIWCQSWSLEWRDNCYQCLTGKAPSQVLLHTMTLKGQLWQTFSMLNEMKINDFLDFVIFQAAPNSQEVLWKEKICFSKVSGKMTC